MASCSLCVCRFNPPLAGTLVRLGGGEGEGVVVVVWGGVYRVCGVSVCPSIHLFICLSMCVWRCGGAGDFRVQSKIINTAGAEGIKTELQQLNLKGPLFTVHTHTHTLPRHQRPHTHTCTPAHLSVCSSLSLFLSLSLCVCVCVCVHQQGTALLTINPTGWEGQSGDARTFEKVLSGTNTTVQVVWRVAVPLSPMAITPQTHSDERFRAKMINAQVDEWVDGWMGGWGGWGRCVVWWSSVVLSCVCVCCVVLSVCVVIRVSSSTMRCGRPCAPTMCCISCATASTSKCVSVCVRCWPRHRTPPHTHHSVCVCVCVLCCVWGRLGEARDISVTHALKLSLAKGFKTVGW